MTAHAIERDLRFWQAVLHGHRNSEHPDDVMARELAAKRIVELTNRLEQVPPTPSSVWSSLSGFVRANMPSFDELVLAICMASCLLYAAYLIGGPR